MAGSGIQIDESKKMTSDEYVEKRRQKLHAHSSVNDDGQRLSTIVGGICWMCWKTEREILDCKLGTVCNQAARKWAAMGNTQ